ncbi:hypothetical protein [Streptomyces noursei]|uniref:hypothetical protein n=1 Tax=Streptomyces noursei TaxID=1971 RepID=UPI001962E3C6|nr:hypothetical protein [Streptomyces noursei]QRX89673.1 hypothetical protein JNO44_01260 [Streptomyces noursei]
MAGSSPVGFVATLLDIVANKMTTDPDHVIHDIGDEPDVLELVVVRKGTRAVLSCGGWGAWRSGRRRGR